MFYFFLEIVELVKSKAEQPFRPSVPLQTTFAALASLVNHCWEENPADRPAIQHIDHYLKSVPGFQRNHQLIDELLRRLNAHAEVLESRIEAATLGFKDEKKRSEDLLSQMLPM